MSIRRALREMWCALRTGHAGRVERDPGGNINHLCSGCGKWAMAVIERAPKPVELPEGSLFNWERDYAPLWEPGSTAFWLEPETPQQLANWFARFRPHVTGIVEAAGLRIEIVPAPTFAPHRPALLDKYAAMESRAALAQKQYNLALMKRVHARSAI